MRKSRLVHPHLVVRNAGTYLVSSLDKPERDIENVRMEFVAVTDCMNEDDGFDL
jgi:hypothetical protein